MDHKLTLKEKIGYGMGDAAANLVWRGALAYLAVFYTDTFGITAAAAAVLFLVVRLSDGVTDIIMGMIADRTQTKMGKFRPWILGSTPFLGLFMVLCFTTPELSYSGKLVYAYLTYIGLTLAYTANNVPYSALMGVMTTDDRERTSLSGFRFAGAFLGGLIVMGCLPMLVNWLGKGNDAAGYQYTMWLFATLLVTLMLITVFTTKERVTVQPLSESGHSKPRLSDVKLGDQLSSAPRSLSSELSDLGKQLPLILIPLSAITAFFYYRDILTGAIFIIVMALTTIAIRRLIRRPESKNSRSQQDIIDLLSNRPWLILLGMGFLTMMFNGIKYGVIAYYFKYYIGNELLTGYFFIALLLVSIVGALATSKLSSIVGRKKLFIVALLASSLLTCGIYFVPQGSVRGIFILGCSAEFFAAILPTLFFSMLGDAADYSEYKTGRRATGLVYSAGSFVQKTGGGFAGALVLLVLGSYGYNGLDVNTISQSLPGMKSLMSWIPALFGFAGAALICLYPLDDEKQREVTKALLTRRSEQPPITA
ncbi:MFS transporter [Alteromonas sp. BL110]|uniref:MFS transporter n=1 Tax=Alteromonas sp. BL110 TaxID=1714845 RepID=UPI000E48C7A2|nr:MFS transporter [Alteromonas sp. BL110]AXT38565.1 MFS transporter [Alteromonas sp. BL110]RKM83285.1 MFS transporter [Alteromonas sp. BL110]